VETELRRAYAVLGLSPPVEEAVLKHQYRELIKRWHPDRYVTDPVGQTEATLRMSEINDAYRIIVATLNASGSSGAVPASLDKNVSGLSRRSIEGIITSINRLASWSLWPEMSRSRWLSLVAFFAYFVVASVLVPGELAANREVAKAVGQALGYFSLPLFLIWTADTQESRVSQFVFRTIGWVFMVAPALLGAVIWAWR
jgi:DnaJ domain